jgi:hypothetical protein
MGKVMLATTANTQEESQKVDKLAK